MGNLADGLMREVHVSDEASLPRLDAALESSDAPVMIADLNGRVGYANAALARLWAFHGTKEIVGSNLKDIFAPEQAAQDLLSRVAADGAWTGDLSGVLVNGTKLPVACTASLVRESDGRATRLVVW
ncbi:MAG: PAS domain-containing protein, partial [Polyangiaceae bacterium]|nr:PAS domain-containing protein [Polyangiaceae bacterium]